MGTRKAVIKTTENRPRVGDGTPGPGRPPGLANKTTRDVRKAIAILVEGNVHKLEEWITAIAEGDENAARAPDPARAADIFLRVLEYHIPRLSRAEIDATIRSPLEEATDEELADILTKYRLKVQENTERRDPPPH